MSWLTRRQFVTTCGLGAASLLSGLGTGGAQVRRPNLVFILADDLGWRDTSLYGSTFYETPNIERLARRGMMFTQAYAANPLCSPTRASILTGLWPARIGITAPVCHVPEVRLEETVRESAGADLKVIPCDSATRLRQEYYTLAEALHDAGYRTGHFGKWHLGREPYDPLHQGFDVDVPHWSGPGPAGSYLAPWKFPPELHFSGEPGEHIEDRMAKEAARFITQNRDRTFFLNYWHFSVHAPYTAGPEKTPQCKPELLAKYRGKVDPNNPQHNPLYAAMVQSLDDAVGTLLDTLDGCGLSDNTVVVFFSDNGGVNFADWEGAPMTSNAPLRGGKASIYEGGVREDCVVVWPGVVQPGSRSDEIIQSIDFYPTLLEVLGVQPRQEVKFDGVSFVPALKQNGHVEREAIFCFFPHNTPASQQLPAVSVRRGDWKLIRFFYDGPHFAHRYELYNLRDDLSETRNLAEEKPALVKELDALIEGWLVETKAVLPKVNPQYNPSARLLEGWRNVRNMNLTVADGKLVVEATGGVATLATFAVPKAAGPVLVSLRARSTAGGPVNAYWANPGEGSFKATRAVRVPLAHDGQWHECTVLLPVEGDLGGLRLDPATEPGKVEIDWICLYSGDGQRLLKEWDFEARRETQPIGEELQDDVTRPVSWA